MSDTILRSDAPPLMTGTTTTNGSGQDARLDSWQSRLLPLMIAMLVGLTLFFFAASLLQLVYLNRKIWDAPRVDVRALRSESGNGELSEAVRFNTLAVLEANVVERRYHQSNVLLMSRVWARYLGFVTGMILALVGAAFILGKLREDVTSLEAKGSGAGLTLQSASPGLVLAVLGVALMAATIVTHQEIRTTDTAVYMQYTDSSAKPPLTP